MSTEVVGSVECPRCHEEVDLIEDDDFPGLAEAVHCGLLIADWWDGTFVYDLAAPADAQEGRRDG